LEEGRVKKRVYHLFVGLNEEELDRLTAIMKERTFKKKEIIATEGEVYPENPSAYIILKGGVDMIKKDLEGKNWKIGIMEESSMFGVENLVGKLYGLKTYPLTYEASSDTDVYTLTNEDLKQTLSQEGYRAMILNLTRYLSRWMRACLERCATMEVLRGYLRV
jgi:CRP-like cAMP-binding protein